MFWIALVLIVFLEAAEGHRLSCTSGEFRCFNGKCIVRHWFCDKGNDCGDNSDELFCEIDVRYTNCPTEGTQWRTCSDMSRCYPSGWRCDGIQDCKDGSDEYGCVNEFSGVLAAAENLTQYFLETKQPARSINKWGPHLSRTAVAIYLTDWSFFSESNATGQEISYELSLQLMSKLALKKKVSTQDLSLFVNSLIVACINPKDFFGVDLVAELRKRVDNSNYTNPITILALCNAKDSMKPNDILKLQEQFEANLRPLWTDTQAIATMALACISSRSTLNVDDRILKKMIVELKRKQHRNGTIDNVGSTALVVQALLATDSYRTDFDLGAAVNFMLQEVNNKYVPIQHLYHILPVLNSRSLINISSEHCSSPIRTGVSVDAAPGRLNHLTVDFSRVGLFTDLLYNLRESPDQQIQVQVSVCIGDDMDFARTWKLKVPTNYTFYQVLERIRSLDKDYQVQYSVSDGKPYVDGLVNFYDNAEDGTYWFIYTQPLSSTSKPQLIEESPVDIELKETEELILWYRSGFWTRSQDTPQ